MFYKNHPKISPNKKFTKLDNSKNSDQTVTENINPTNYSSFSSDSNSTSNLPKFRSGNFRPKVPLTKEKKQIPSHILNQKQFLFSKVASFLLVIAILIFGSSFYLWQNQNSLGNNLVQNLSNSSSLSSSSGFSSNSSSINSESTLSSSSVSSSSSAKTILVDNKAAKISEFVKKNSNIDMGELSYQTLEELNIKPPIDVSKIEQSSWQENSQNKPNKPNKPNKLLEEIIPKTKELEDKNVEPKTTLDKKNLLVFPKYKIEAPIIHLTFDDMYPRDKLGNTNFAEEVNYPLDRANCQIPAYRDTCHPVQKALEKGVVHLPMSVHPGEIGTSYIAGHTSNWQFIKSPYNAIFKPMEGQTKVGDEFFVFDNWGRRLRFRIFDSLEIRADDLANAYKKFDNRRTITLQGSVLKWTKQGLQPTHRWLSRGELVEEVVSSNLTNSSNSTNNSTK